MTFSIIAHDVASGQVGIAAASKTLATGARVPHIRTGVGAIASQARVNRYYGPRGLAETVRSSVHYYNDDSDLDRLVEGVKEIAWSRS